MGPGDSLARGPTAPGVSVEDRGSTQHTTNNTNTTHAQHEIHITHTTHVAENRKITEHRENITEHNTQTYVGKKEHRAKITEQEHRARLRAGAPVKDAHADDGQPQEKVDPLDETGLKTTEPVARFTFTPRGLGE